MNWKRQIAKVQALFARRKPVDDLAEEIRSHLRMEEQENLESGMPPDEAHDAALRRFGNVTLAQERSREMWGWNSLETLWQDLRYGLRMLVKNPGFTAVAVVTLALGIGANTAIFSMLDTLLLKTLPVSHPQQLVLLRWASLHNTTDYLPYPTFAQLRDNSNALAGMFAFCNVGLATNINGTPAIASGQLVSGSFFQILGVPAIAGRTFTTEEDLVPGRDPVAVISYGYWKRQFALDPAVVGKSITLNGQPFTIVGVTAPGFEGVNVGSSQDIWMPMMMQAQVMDARSLLNDPKGWFFEIIARLKTGVTLEQAIASLNVAYQQIARQQAGSRISPRVEQELASEKILLLPASRGLSDLRDRFREPLLVLMVLVGLVLLVSCANVAGLLLARASVRQKEIVVREALGAGQGRIIRQLLTESLLLATLGGLVGLLFARYGDILLLKLPLTSGRPFVLTLRPDATTLVFTTVVALLAAILFGCAPAWKAARLDLNSALNASTRGAMTGESKQGSRWNFRKLVVMGEVTVSLLLLTGAGLLVRTLSKLRDVNPGFNQDGLLLVSLDPTLLGYRGDRLATLYNQLPDAIRTVPGVRSVTMSAVPPLSRRQWRTGVFIQGHALGAREDTTVLWNLIGPNYFRTLETPLLQGREFTMLDNATAPKVAIFNEAMARFYFGRSSAVGKRVSFVSPEAGEIEIVVVVADAKYGSLREATPHMLFLPYLQTPGGSVPFGVTMEIRTGGNPEALVEAVRQAIRSMDKNIPMASATLAEVVNRSLAQEQTVAELSSFFSLLALLLAAVGLYGVMTYTVARRTGEIGIRMALGAEQSELLRMVLRESLELVATGLALGIPLVLVFARALSGQLYGISAFDPWSVSIASAVLVSVSALASYIPARRATTVDPIAALRHE
jgi:predicted permease